MTNDTNTAPAELQETELENTNGGFQVGDVMPTFVRSEKAKAPNGKYVRILEYGDSLN